MAMEKLLTIIIPSYNMEKFLPQCLDSLVNCQNASLLDVLVVNDGSKDGTLEIGRQYQSKYPEIVRVIDKENGNYGSCINRGVLEGCGKYVKVLDADDRFDASNLDEYLSTLQSVDVDLFLTDTIQVRPDDSCIKTISFGIPAKQVVKFAEYCKVDEMPMHGITYKLENVRKLGYKQTEGISYTDTEWAFFPVEAVETCFYLPKIVYRYLIGREGQTMAPEVYKKGRNQELTITKRMVDFWDALSPEKERRYFDQYLLHRLRRIYLQDMTRNNDGSDKFLEEMDSYIKEHSARLYDLLGNSLYGKREKIPFIRDWRKKNKPSLRFRLCVMLHRLLGNQK